MVKRFEDRTLQIYDETSLNSATTSGQINLTKKKKNKALRAARDSSSSQPGPSTSTSGARTEAKKKNRKKMHPKTPKE